MQHLRYGGRITDDLDRELFITYAARWLCDEMFKASFAFNSYNSDYQYKIPEGLDMNVYRDHIETIPPVESPLIFGLHPNADITYRLKEASEMLTTIIETQPKDTNASVGKSMDEQVRTVKATLPGTNMEVENHLFVVENGLQRGHSPLPC